LEGLRKTKKLIKTANLRTVVRSGEYIEPKCSPLKWSIQSEEEGYISATVSMRSVMELTGHLSAITGFVSRWVQSGQKKCVLLYKYVSKTRFRNL